MSFRKLSYLSATMLIASSIGITAVAHGDEKHQKNRFAESKLRHDVMEVFSDGFGKIMKIRKGEGGSPADFPAIAAAMAEAAGKTKASFEKDTRGFEGYTEAKDTIWENWEDFAGRLDQMEIDAKAFAVATKSGDMSQIGPAMGALGKNCKSCHDKYKAD